jgi:hypothetical protein
MKNSRTNKQVLDFRLTGFGLLASSLCCLLALALPSPAQAGSESCIRLEIKKAVRLPHGELLGPGTLRICREKLSPVSHLHRASLDGHPVALLLSQTKVKDVEGQLDPVVVFHKGVDGQLLLVGYSIPNGHDHSVHRFVRHGRSVTTEVRVSEPQILIAAAYD